MITENLNNIGVIIDALTDFVPKIVALSATLATIIPQKSAFGFAIHKLALNFGAAKNANE